MTKTGTVFVITELPLMAVKALRDQILLIKTRMEYVILVNNMSNALILLIKTGTVFAIIGPEAAREKVAGHATDEDPGAENKI